MGKQNVIDSPNSIVIKSSGEEAEVKMKNFEMRKTILAYI